MVDVRNDTEVPETIERDGRDARFNFGGDSGVCASLGGREGGGTAEETDGGVMMVGLG